MAEIWDNILAKIGQLWQTLLIMWVDLQADEKKFWLTVGVLTLLALALLLLLVRSATRRHARRQEGVSEDTGVLFVPVDADKDTAELFLPLSGKLLAEGSQREEVSPEMLQKIRERKPESLEDVLLALNKLSGSYREDLRRLIGSEQLLPLYVKTLGQADYQPYTLAAAWREYPDQAVLPVFVELLASREEAVQMAAVRLLTALNEPACLTYLASALLQPHRYVPARVAEVLVALGESAAWLLCYLLPEIPGENKPLVLSVLGQMQPGYPLEQVIACLKDANEQTRRSAAATLGDANAMTAVPELCAAAADESWAVRAAVAKALGQIGEAAAVPYLSRLAADEVWMVAINAREALRQIGVGQKAGWDSNDLDTADPA